MPSLPSLHIKYIRIMNNSRYCARTVTPSRSILNELKMEVSKTDLKVDFKYEIFDSRF